MKISSALPVLPCTQEAPPKKASSLKASALSECLVRSTSFLTVFFAVGM